MRKKYLQEKKIKESAFARLDGLRMEIRAIEGQDIGDDIWKEKWKELFGLCIELQKENEELRNNVQIPEMNNIASPGVDSVKENIDSMASHTHDDKSFKPYMMERFGAKTLTTKPSTAAQQNRLLKSKKQGYMSGGSLAAELGMNPTETSPRGSVKSSGFKKIYSKISHHHQDKNPHVMPKISQNQFNRKVYYFLTLGCSLTRSPREEEALRPENQKSTIQKEKPLRVQLQARGNEVRWRRGVRHACWFLRVWDLHSGN
jgi:hypothetical protein